MKKIRSFLLLSAFLAFVLIVVALVRTLITPSEPKPVGRVPPPGVNVQIDNIHYEQTDENAFKDWELDAKSAQYLKEENKIVFTAIVVTFYSSQGKVYTLTADRGELHTDSKDVEVSGNVTAVTGEGYRIHTHSFRYRARDRKIVTPDEVTLVTEQLVMSGRGMVVDLEEEELQIMGEVKALEKK